MKLGYPCLNWSIGCKANATFRLNNYSEQNQREKVRNNLECLKRILEFNVEQGFLFFRISSELIPFASHPVSTLRWQEEFKDLLKEIGEGIRKHKMRISMHPDQFVLINSPKQEVVDKSVADLTWHCQLLDGMNLSRDAKVQIHVGGVYGDKEQAINRFVENYKVLSDGVRRRLVIENDDRLFSLQDCLDIHQQTKIPILFDNFHHECLNEGQSMREAIRQTNKTWTKKDGLLMTDYSSQEPNARKGKHISSINLEHFNDYVTRVGDADFDIMLEIKDKESSASKALEILQQRGKL